GCKMVRCNSGRTRRRHCGLSLVFTRCRRHEWQVFRKMPRTDTRYARPRRCGGSKAMAGKRETRGTQTAEARTPVKEIAPVVKALGINVPPSMQARADEMIE